VIVGFVVALACVASAGGNPAVRAYIDFDPPNYVHEVHPAPYTTVDAYVCLDGLDQGVTALAFQLEYLPAVCPDAIAVMDWQAVPPWGPMVGAPWPWPGTILATYECVTSEPVLVASVTMFYIGGECCIELLDHGEYGRCVWDCSDPCESDAYCVLSHGSIGEARCPPGDCTVPVRDGTWGTIKSLYR